MAKIPAGDGPRYPQVVVLVGATGDLARRKLWPDPPDTVQQRAREPIRRPGRSNSVTASRSTLHRRVMPQVAIRVGITKLRNWLSIASRR